MPDTPALRKLPRFEVVKIGRSLVAYDFLTKQARFPADPKSFIQAQMLVEVMAGEARAKGEVLALERAEHPSAAPKSSKSTKPEQH